MKWPAVLLACLLGGAGTGAVPLLDPHAPTPSMDFLDNVQVSQLPGFLELLRAAVRRHQAASGVFFPVSDVSAAASGAVEYQPLADLVPQASRVSTSAKRPASGYLPPADAPKPHETPSAGYLPPADAPKPQERPAAGYLPPADALKPRETPAAGYLPPPAADKSDYQGPHNPHDSKPVVAGSAVTPSLQADPNNVPVLAPAGEPKKQLRPYTGYLPPPPTERSDSQGPNKSHDRGHKAGGPSVIPQAGPDFTHMFESPSSIIPPDFFTELGLPGGLGADSPPSGTSTSSSSSQHFSSFHTFHEVQHPSPLHPDPPPPQTAQQPDFSGTGEGVRTQPGPGDRPDLGSGLLHVAGLGSQQGGQPGRGGPGHLDQPAPGPSDLIPHLVGGQPASQIGTVSNGDRLPATSNSEKNVVAKETQRPASAIAASKGGLGTDGVLYREALEPASNVGGFRPGGNPEKNIVEKGPHGPAAVNGVTVGPASNANASSGTFVGDLQPHRPVINSGPQFGTTGPDRNTFVKVTHAITGDPIEGGAGPTKNTDQSGRFVAQQTPVFIPSRTSFDQSASARPSSAGDGQFGVFQTGAQSGPSSVSGVSDGVAFRQPTSANGPRDLAPTRGQSGGKPGRPSNGAASNSGPGGDGSGLGSFSRGGPSTKPRESSFGAQGPSTNPREVFQFRRDGPAAGFHDGSFGGQGPSTNSQGVFGQTGPSKNFQGTFRQTGPSTNNQGTFRQTGPSTNNQGTFRQTGPSTNNQGTFRQTGPSTNNQGTFRQTGPSTNNQGTFRQTGPSTNNQGTVRKTRPSSNTRDGSFRQTGPSTNNQGTFRETGPSTNTRDGSFRQTGPSTNNQGTFRKTGPSTNTRDGSFRQTGLSTNPQGTFRQTGPSTNSRDFSASGSGSGNRGKGGPITPVTNPQPEFADFSDPNFDSYAFYSDLRNLYGTPK